MPRKQATPALKRFRVVIANANTRKVEFAMVAHAATIDEAKKLMREKYFNASLKPSLKSLYVESITEIAP